MGQYKSEVHRLYVKLLTTVITANRLVHILLNRKSYILGAGLEFLAQGQHNLKGRTLWTFALDGQTRCAKLSPQTVNLPGAQASISHCIPMREDTI